MLRLKEIKAMLGMLHWERNNRQLHLQLHLHFSTVTDLWHNYLQSMCMKVNGK